MWKWTFVALALSCVPAFAPDEERPNFSKYCWRLVNTSQGFNPSGFGDLTVEEVAEIQTEVDRFGRLVPDLQIWVVGSAARGQRKLGSRGDHLSDIDYVIPREFVVTEVELGDEGGVTLSWNIMDFGDAHLPRRDEDFGFFAGQPNLAEGPAILFRPGRAPVFLPHKP